MNQPMTMKLMKLMKPKHSKPKIQEASQELVFLCLQTINQYSLKK